MIHCSSTLPPNAAAMLTFPAGEGKAPREIRVPVPSLNVLDQLQQRWSFTWELLQCSYLVLSCSAHLLHPRLRKAFSSFSFHSSQHRQSFIQNKCGINDHTILGWNIMSVWLHHWAWECFAFHVCLLRIWDVHLSSITLCGQKPQFVGWQGDTLHSRIPGFATGQPSSYIKAWYRGLKWWHPLL